MKLSLRQNVGDVGTEVDHLRAVIHYFAFSLRKDIRE